MDLYQDTFVAGATAPTIAFSGTNSAGNLFFWLIDDVAVTDAAQTISITSTAPTSAVVGDHYEVNASGGGSNNPVQLLIDHNSAAVCTIDDSGLVTFTGVGVCSLDATQAGRAPWLTAPTVGQTINVYKAPQFVAFTSVPAHAVAGNTYPLTATGGNSGNPIVFTAASASSSVCTVTSGGLLTALAAGRCVITAKQAGNSNYKAGTAKQSITVYRS